MRSQNSISMTTRVIAGFILGGLLSLTACGYGLQNTKGSELERLNLRKIYVSPLRNDTFKSGVEHTVYNALVKGLASYRFITIVQKEDEADAKIVGGVSNVSLATTPKSADSLAPSNNNLPAGMDRSRFKDRPVASEYRANLGCYFSLIRLKKDGKSVSDYMWGESFSRDKPFPATNQLGPLGTTSALINDSEFDRTLQDLAVSMMSDVRETLLARF